MLLVCPLESHRLGRVLFNGAAGAGIVLARRLLELEVLGQFRGGQVGVLGELEGDSKVVGSVLGGGVGVLDVEIDEVVEQGIVFVGQEVGQLGCGPEDQGPEMGHAAQGIAAGGVVRRKQRLSVNVYILLDREV